MNKAAGGGGCQREGGVLGGGGQKGKTWDNCDSIMNKKIK